MPSLDAVGFGAGDDIGGRGGWRWSNSNIVGERRNGLRIPTLTELEVLQRSSGGSADCYGRDKERREVRHGFRLRKRARLEDTLET